MSRSKRVLVGTLILLFLGLSFNAYACILPLNGISASAMGNGCSTPDEQPVSQVCDVFKTISVQSVEKLHLSTDCQALCPADTASLALLVIHISPSSYVSDHSPAGPPQDLLLKISVLRI